MKRYSRTIDLWAGLVLLIAQYILQLALCVTIVPIYNVLDNLRRRSRSWSWRRGKSSEPEVIVIDQVERDEGGQTESTPILDLSSTNNDRPTPTTPPKDPEPPLMSRKKPRKSVLDNVIEFSLGSPKTLRQAVHQAKALYDAPRPSGLRQEVDLVLPRNIGKGDSGTRRPSGIRLDPKGKAPSKVIPAPGPVRSKITGKPPVEAASRLVERQGETEVTRSRQPVQDVGIVASQTNGRNPRTLRSKAPEAIVRGTKGSSKDPIVLDDRGTEGIESSVITSRMSKTTEAAFLARLGSGLGHIAPGNPSNPLSLEDVEEETLRGMSREGEDVGQPVASSSTRTVPDLENDDMHIEQADLGSTEEKVTPQKRKATENPVDKRTVKTRKVDEGVRPAPGTRVARVKTAVQGSNPVEPGPSHIRVRKAAEKVSTGSTTTAKPAPKTRAKTIRSQNDERPRTRSARRKEEAVAPSRSASPALEPLPVPPTEPIRPKRVSGSAGIGTKRVARDLGPPRRPDNR
jgi:hypothetical protein